MKVTILSIIDYAGSAYKLCEAIEQHTDIDVDLFTGSSGNVFNHPIRNIITADNKKQVQERIDSSDIIHLKGDWPPSSYVGLNLKKPIVVTVSGSFFRRKPLGIESFPFSAYDCHRTSFEPDLCYPEFTDVWIPHPIDSEDRPNIWKQSNILVHSPTNRYKKDTDFILRVFDKLPECEIRLIEGKSFKEAVNARKEATIFFDQFRVGWYGNSAIEAMQYGIPTASWISLQSKRQAKGGLRGCPVITDTKDVNIWVEMIKKLLDSDMQKLSDKTKEWTDSKHSYRAVAKSWETYYKEIL